MFPGSPPGASRGREALNVDLLGMLDAFVQHICKVHIDNDALRAPVPLHRPRQFRPADMEALPLARVPRYIALSLRSPPAFFLGGSKSNNYC